MVGSFAGRRVIVHSGKADVAVRVKFRDVDVRVGQRLESYRAEERLLRLDQQDRLREARIVEAAAEVDARLYGEARPLQVERVHDLSEVLADQDDIAWPEGDAHPEPAGDLRHARDRALDP